MVTGAWLNGILSQADPNPDKYPTLESLLGEDKRTKPEDEIPDDPDAASRNARAWGVVLQAMNRRESAAAKE